MPAYEIALVFRQLDKPALVAAVKQAAEAVMDCGGYIRQIEHVWRGPLGNKVCRYDLVHREGSFWRFNCDHPSDKIPALSDFLTRDINLLRFMFLHENKMVQTPDECSFHEDTKPAPHRKKVQDMIAATEKMPAKKRFHLYTELDFFPFQR